MFCPGNPEKFSLEHQEPLIAEFYLRLEDGRISCGRTGMTYSWCFDDWLLLPKYAALNIEEFCWSMLFEIYAAVRELGSSISRTGQGSRFRVG
jgi:hypothetical protein